MSVSIVAEFEGLQLELSHSTIERTVLGERGRPWTAFVTFGEDNPEGALGFGSRERTPDAACEAALKHAKRRLGGLTRRVRRAQGRAAKGEVPHADGA